MIKHLYYYMLILLFYIQSKHIGFIIEAGVEALPQSLLQLVAIVYYEETNYISIISISLSMISVMTKSLVLSQGIDIKTYIWTWLCIITDFFGIFFVLSWVFYTNEIFLQPVFLKYFSIIGAIWCWKVIIGILPIIAVSILAWLTYFFWNMLYEDIYVSYYNMPEKIGYTLLLIIFTVIGIPIGSCLGFLVLEIVCFTSMAIIVYKYSTNRWNNSWHYLSTNRVNQIIDFMKKSENRHDEMLRLLAINYETTKFGKQYRSYANTEKLNTLIDQKYKDQGLQALKLCLCLLTAKIKGNSHHFIYI